MQLLAEQARKARENFGQAALVVAFVHKETKQYLLLPVEDHGTPRFESGNQLLRVSNFSGRLPCVLQMTGSR
jgi:hypothetical protein